MILQFRHSFLTDARTFMVYLEMPVQRPG